MKAKSLEHFRQLAPVILRNRNNKTSRGFAYTWERTKSRRRWQKSELSDDVISLHVHGTFDFLAGGRWMLVKLADIPHPTDAGYFKKAYVLTDKGRQKLDRLRSGRMSWQFEEIKDLYYEKAGY